MFTPERSASFVRRRLHTLELHDKSISSVSTAQPAGALAAVRRALVAAEQQGYDDAWTLPHEVYTDTDVMAVERAALFGQEWVCIGRGDEIAQVGDTMPWYVSLP